MDQKWTKNGPRIDQKLTEKMAKNGPKMDQKWARN